MSVFDGKNHLSDLNPAQQQAVMHGDGPLLIFAGAGSGKTRVLTRRIAHLISEHGVDPMQILAVTFTNKAAREMKERVDKLFGARPLPVWVATFHSTAVRILRAHAKYLDFSPQFAIYDTSDSISALKRVYKRLNVDPKILEPRTILSKMDKAKNDYKFSDSIRKDPYIPQLHRELIANIFDGYQEELRTSNAMDFGDLLCNVVTLFSLEPKLLEQYQERFRYLLIDEYQDTNKVQYLLIKMLASRHKNLCVVGDDDQSIYAFRGASVENILNFRKDFPGAKVVTLDTNYRSTKNILSAANAIIAHNRKREPKQMRTDNPAGSAIMCYKAHDEKDEASFVVREISVLMRNGRPATDFAIFYRTNSQSRSIEEALCEAGLPYEIYGGHKFYERKEIKDILAYFRVLLNPQDNEAFLRIINTPTRGIGDTAVGAIVAAANKRGMPLLSAMQEITADAQSGISAAQRTKFRKFLELIASLQEDAADAEAKLQSNVGAFEPFEVQEALANLLKQIADQSGYLPQLRAQDTTEADARIDNIQELFRVAVEFAIRCLDQGAAPSLYDFLDRTSLGSDMDEAHAGASEVAGSPKKGAVSLMTLHLAKGLEFDIVFLIGLEEGILPHVRSLEDREGLEEERRLCYVGITRARKVLYLTRATDRQSFGRGNWYSGVPSRFIRDLPFDVLSDRGAGFVPKNGY